MRQRFLTLFPYTENIHLIKDVGMVPYILHKYKGFDATIACYKIGSYPYLEHEVKGLKIAYIRRIFGNATLDGLWFILMNFRRYDTLMCFHWRTQSLLWFYLFKFLKGKNSQTYLKLDTGRNFKNVTINDHPKKKLLKIFQSKIDLITVETKELLDFINKKKEMQVKYLPNGFYDEGIRKQLNIQEKENLIITVGRIGDKNKSTEILCEAFALFSPEHKEWRLKLIGQVDPSFHNYMTDYYKRFPELIDKIELTGPVKDRMLLDAYYKKAKIFALTSKSESFGIVLLEALVNGCYILTTDIVAAEDVTDQQRYGKIFPVDDINALTTLLKQQATEGYISDRAYRAQQFAYEHFYWPVILNRLPGWLLPDSLN